MTELKTLKDLQKDCEWKYDTYKALKAEAIKWVKHLEQSKKLPKHFKILNVNVLVNKKGLDEVKEWIKYFFNLTEEDLK